MASGLSCFDCDANGLLYGVCHDGTSVSIVAIDARHQILGSSDLKDGQSFASVPASQLHVSTAIKTSPEIDFDVKTISVSCNGHYLLLVGYQGQDQDIACVAVVDLYGGSLTTPVPAVSGAVAAVGAKLGLFPPPQRCKLCTLHSVDPQMFRGRPGLIVHQASWHPHSDGHLAVLTSDSHWRLYGLEDLSLAEQAFDLRVALSKPPLVPAVGPQQSILPPAIPSTPSAATSRANPPPSTPSSTTRFGIGQSASSSILVHGVTAFGFGIPVSWGYFTVLFLASSGAVYTLCPVCPFGMRVPASVLQQALEFSSAPGEDSGADLQTAWLKSVFGVDAVAEQFAGKSRWTAQRHMHEGRPLLQGPLNAGSIDSNAALQRGRSPAVALHTAYKLNFGSSLDAADCDASGRQAPLSLSAQACTSVVVVGHADGRLLAHACHGLLGPCWADDRAGGAARCVADAKGSVRAIRYECGSLPLPTDEELSGGITCGALLLLDVIDLQLPAAASVDDDNDDECCAGVLGPSAGLDRLSLLGSEDSPEMLWAVHATGCWTVTLPWLPLLSKALAPSSSQKRPRTAGEAADPGLEAALAALPPPLVRELISVPSAIAASSSSSPAATSGSRLVAAAHLHDMFLGDSLVAVTQQAASLSSTAAPPAAAAAPARAGWGTTTFQCYLQRLAAPPDILEADAGATISVDGGAAAAAGSGTSAMAPASASTPGSVSKERKSLVDASLKAIYADLLVFPPAVLPKPKGPVGFQDAEGALYLHECIQQLRLHHVEFVHRADQDLRQRVQQLGGEMVAHRSTAEDLQALMAAARERQTRLSERSHRAMELHRNLSERAAILAQLHWSLPRPLSDAESQLSVELDTYKAERQALAESWGVLKRRLDAALATRAKATETTPLRGGRGGSLAPQAESLPPAQLAKVHAAMMEQFRQLSGAMHDLKHLEGDVAKWRLESEV